MDKLDKLISDHAYEVYLTKDLPAEEQDKEQLRLHGIYKQAIEAYIAEQTRLARIDELKNIKEKGYWESGFIEGEDYWFISGDSIQDRLDHLSKKDDIESNIERQKVDIGDK